MIIVGSQPFQTMITELKMNKSKSCRDTLCSRCWRMFSYTQFKKHISETPDHQAFAVSALDYSSDEKLIQIGI
jgi:hypothetical protein